MLKKQLQYQVRAADKAIEHLQDNKEFKLQSPTGSGKTFIISQIIDKYLEDDYLNTSPTTFIFIAPSTGSLDYQGYEKISQYKNKDWVKGFDTEYIGTSKSKNQSKSYLSNIDYFKENTIYFFGWQMFKKGTRITEIDSEKNDIYKVIFNTKERNINVVLIIDEAHREVRSTKDDINTKQIIINDLNPFRIIKVSATFDNKIEKPDWIISYDDVREECAIKQNVIISQLNEKVKDIDKYNEEEQLIISAIEKQKEIINQYNKKKIDINPLILIQIPDNVTIDKDIKTEDELLKRIDSILEKQGYKLGYNYVKWLHNDKTTKNKEEITDNKSKFDILIFKTAIATGWDIPRANILVRIREAKTKAFNIQTLGRILRNPFFKYYGNDLIDNAYVFTRDEKYKEYIKEESIVNDEEEIKIISRSKVAKDSTFSINKFLYKTSKDYDEDELIKFISNQIINHKEFKDKFFKYDEQKDSIIRGTYKEDAKNILSGNQNIEKSMSKSKEAQSRLNINSQPRLTLFDLYIKYRTITKSSTLNQRVLEQISNSLKPINKTIKEFYKSCCYNWARNIFNISNTHDMTSLKSWIDNLKNQFLKDHIKHEVEEYKLPNEYKVSTRKFDISDWDGINTFNAKLKFESKDDLDSNYEREFYRDIKNKDWDNVHIFRNGTSKENDYYVEYIDNEAKIRRFFPDFILINEKTKQCLILEAKGDTKHSNIDQNRDAKFDSLVGALKRNKTKHGYQCHKLIQVSLKNDETSFIDVDENESINWRDVKKLLDIE